MPDTVVTSEMEKALSKAKVYIMAADNTVFFSTFMLGLGHFFSETIERAATNGRSCMYNPEWFMSIRVDERPGVVLHETLHPAMLHMFRRKDRHFPTWNAACDYVINIVILDAGFKLPEPFLHDEIYRNMSSEDVYDELMKQSEEERKDLFGDFTLDIQEPGEDSEESENDIEDLIVQAVMQSRMSGETAGTIPGEIEIFVDGLLSPIVPWHKHLGPFLRKLIKAGHSYSKPHRRYQPKYILPTRQSYGLVHIVCAADISGSVSTEGFHHFVSEGGALIKNHRPDGLTFITFDTQIRNIVEAKQLRDLHETEFHGRGGTNIDPIMQWAVDNAPNVLIVFTDGYYTPPTIKPKCPVIWVVYNNDNFWENWGNKTSSIPRFGKYIQYNFVE